MAMASHFEPRFRLAHWMAMGSVPGSALVLYLFTLSPVIYPGPSAAALARHLSVDPFPAFTDPLWGALIRLIAALTPASPLALNATGALLVTAALALIASTLLRLIPDATGNPVQARRSPSIAAGLGVAYAAVSVPIWIAATRAHPAAMDLFLAASLLRLFTGYLQSRRPGTLRFAVLVYGISVVECPSFYLAAPIVALLVARTLAIERSRRLHTLAGLLASFATGLLLYLPAALIHLNDPSLDWRGIPDAAMLMREVLREHAQSIRDAVPRVGWLTSVLVTGLPLVLALLDRQRPSRIARLKPARLILRLVLLGTLIAVLFNAPVAPWSLAAAHTLPILPYLSAALAFGLLASRLTLDLRPLGRIAQMVPALAGLLIVVSAGVQYRTASGHSARPVDAFVQAIIEQAGDRAWLLSTGELDYEIQLAAALKGSPLRLINLRAAHEPAYRRFYASQIDDPKIKGLMEVGLSIGMQEWIRDPGAALRMASLSFPDRWREAGYESIPAPLLFKPAQSIDADTIAAAVSAADDYWSAYSNAFHKLRQDSYSPARAWLPFIQQQLTRSANELGVLAHDHAQPGLARRAYKRALKIDQENLNALMNLSSLARDENDPDAYSLAEAVKKAIHHRSGSLPIDSMIARHGSIRSAGLAAARGLAALQTGDQQVARSALERSITLGGPERAPRLGLAELYRQIGHTAGSDEQYEAILSENPRAFAAWIGLARNAVATGDVERAGRLIERLTDAGAPAEVVQVEHALLAFARGQLREGVRYLDQLDEEVRSKPRIQWMLARAHRSLGDVAGFRGAFERLAAMPDPGFEGALLLAREHARQGDLERARERSDQALRLNPGAIEGWDFAIRFRLASGDAVGAEALIPLVSQRDPGHPVAQYLQGRVHARHERWVQAEACFRSSLEREESAAALNDLAYVLFLRRNYEESESFARRAITRAPALSAPWDTLAQVQYARGERAQALESIRRARELNPADPGHARVEARIRR